MSKLHHVPKGFHTINAYLIVSDAAQLIEFAKTVFDAQETLRMPSPDGGIAHAELRIGDSVLETSDATEKWKATPGSLHIYVPDIDATYRRALSAGAESLMEPMDQFYGERSASVRDPLGNLWHIATKTEEITVEEMKRRAAELHKS